MISFLHWLFKVPMKNKKPCASTARDARPEYPHAVPLWFMPMHALIPLITVRSPARPTDFNPWLMRPAVLCWGKLLKGQFNNLLSPAHTTRRLSESVQSPTTPYQRICTNS